MLSKIDLDTPYIDLINSVKNGDIIQFESFIENSMDRLIQLGTFLIIGKLRYYIFRNLLFYVYKANEEDIIKNNVHVIKLNSIFNVLNNVYNCKDITMDDLYSKLLYLQILLISSFSRYPGI